MDQLGVVIVPAPGSNWGEAAEEIALSGTRTKQGRVFEKHILSFGDLIHPVTGTKIPIDKAFADKLVKNFNDSICPIVQVPLANDQNDHVESPKSNLGEVLGLRVDEKAGKIYAQVDAREDAEKFGKTYLGASAFMHLNYMNTKTGKRAGPTLLHVAVTNRPYVTDLDPYEELVAASAGLEAEDFGEPALLEMSAPGGEQQGDQDKETAVPDTRTLKDILDELKAAHGVDVEELQVKLTAAETASAESELKAAELEVNLSHAQHELESRTDVEELAEKVRVALSGSPGFEGQEIALSGTDGALDADTIVAAVGELAQQNVALSASSEAAVERIAALEKRNVETEIDGLVATGFILPAKRDVFLNLALSNRETFDALLPEEPLVKLSVEKGTAPKAEEHQKQEVDVEAELTRLTAPDGPMAEYLRA